MRFFFTIIAFAVTFCLCILMAEQAYAQNENLDIVNEPICFTVINEAPFSVFGDFRTDYYTRPDGIKARHRSNFRLTAKGEINEKTGKIGDRSEFCSYGPFLPDRKLHFTLRTLVPIFSCKTKITEGPIVIKGFKKPEGGTETWAECYL